METIFVCPKCGERIPVKSELIGELRHCPACGEELDAGKQCFRCGNMFSLTKLIDYEGLKICPRCLNMMQRDEQAKSQRKKRVIIQVSIIVLLVAAFFIVKEIFWGQSLPCEITDVEGGVDSRGNLVVVEVSIRQGNDKENDEYAVIYAIDSKKDIAKIARKVIKESKASKTGRHHLARWMPGDKKQQCFLGDYGKGGLQWIDRRRRSRKSGNSLHRYIDEDGASCKRFQWINPEVIQCSYCIEDVGIHAVVFFQDRPPKLDELNLDEKDFGQFKVVGRFVVKAQVWCRNGDNWEPASEVFEEEYSQ